MKKQSPVIIEAERSEGDNKVSFALRGSLAWLEEMKHFVMFNLGVFTARLWEDASAAQRQDLLNAINAFQRGASYHSELITITIAREETK
jgi:hypothetical protein